MPYGVVKAATQVREERAALEGYRHMLYYSPAHYLVSRLQPFFAEVFSFQGIHIFIIIGYFLQNRIIIGIAIPLVHLVKLRISRKHFCSVNCHFLSG